MELALGSQCRLIWSLCQCKHGVENDRGILVITLAAILSLFIKVPNICPRACQAAVSSYPDTWASPPLCWHRQSQSRVSQQQQQIPCLLSSHISWNHWAVNWWWSRVFPAPACYHGPCAPSHGLMSDSHFWSQVSGVWLWLTSLGTWWLESMTRLWCQSVLLIVSEVIICKPLHFLDNHEMLLSWQECSCRQWWGNWCMKHWMSSCYTML